MSQDKQKSSKDRNFTRGALIEGDSAGKLPTPRWTTWGWWFWPLSALTIAGFTYWGARHIEGQIGNAALKITAEEGFDASKLQFTPDYRDVTVTGVLPQKLNAETLEQLLQDYRGSNGESIYKVQVNASARPAYKHSLNSLNKPVTKKYAEVLVNASLQDDLLVLSGTVPSASHSATISNAAMQSFSEDQIQNNIRVLNLPPSFEDAKLHVNSLATVLSNLKENVSSADVTLDNNLLAGFLYTNTELNRSALQAKMTGVPIQVLVRQGRFATVESELTLPPTIESPTVEAPTAEELALETIKIPDIDSTFDKVQKNKVTEAAELQQALDNIYDQISDNVVFKSNSAILQDTAYPVLNEIVALLKKHQNPCIEIAGHTDNIGNENHNKDLSYTRAVAVSKYLAEMGINTVRLKAEGYGESRPLHSNTTIEGRQLNRRVEFISYSNTFDR